MRDTLKINRISFALAGPELAPLSRDERSASFELISALRAFPALYNHAFALRLASYSSLLVCLSKQTRQLNPISLLPLLPMSCAYKARLFHVNWIHLVFVPIRPNLSTLHFNYFRSNSNFANRHIPNNFQSLSLFIFHYASLCFDYVRTNCSIKTC